jgi:hypothetical protein
MTAFVRDNDDITRYESEAERITENNASGFMIAGCWLSANRFSSG